MTDVEFKALVERLHAVDGPNCGDMLAIFAEAAAEHGWAWALATFDTVVARHFPAQRSFNHPQEQQ